MDEARIVTDDCGCDGSFLQFCCARLSEGPGGFSCTTVGKRFRGMIDLTVTGIIIMKFSDLVV